MLKCNLEKSVLGGTVYFAGQFLLVLGRKPDIAHSGYITGCICVKTKLPPTQNLDTCLVTLNSYQLLEIVSRAKFLPTL